MVAYEAPVAAVAAAEEDCMVLAHAVLMAEDEQAGQVAVVAAAAAQQQVVVRAMERRFLALGEVVKEVLALLTLTATWTLSRLLPSASLAGLSAR